MLKLLDCRRDRAVVLSPYVAGLSYEDEQQLNDLPGDSARPGAGSGMMVLGLAPLSRVLPRRDRRG
jgi:hypothetical protein